MKILMKPVIGLQEKKADTSYRLMTYVVEQEIEEGVLLYNTLTCAMALVTHEEAQHLTEVEGLVENWFLVPVDHNDKRLCRMARVSAMLQKKQPKGIRGYTIVTTTGCNARCPYCYEQGTKPIHMTTETAVKVAQYIISHRGEQKKIKIHWFGGEPLYNFKVMDCICNRLREHDIPYHSTMTTNGYLFSERLVEKAINLWNMKKVQITIDGTEDNYNRIKGYVHSNDRSPYHRVMENIKRLLDTGTVKVNIRVHLTHDNLDDIWALTRELVERFQGYDNLIIYYYPIFEQFGPTAKARTSQQRQLIYEGKNKLQNYLKEWGNIGKTKAKLRKGIRINMCKVDSGDAVMILPDGRLGLCEHHMENHFIGHIDNDQWDEEEVKKSREYWEEIPECDTCAYYPQCFRLKICGTYSICFKEWREDNIETIRQQMIDGYHAELKELTGEQSPCEMENK